MIKAKSGEYLFCILGHTLSKSHRLEDILIPINDECRHCYNITEIYTPRQDIEERNELEYAIKETRVLFINPHGTDYIPAIDIDIIHGWDFRDLNIINAIAIGCPVPIEIGEIDYENKKIDVKKVVVEGVIDVEINSFTQSMAGNPLMKNGARINYYTIFNGICGGGIFTILNGSPVLIGIAKSAGENEIGFYISSVLKAVLSQDIFKPSANLQRPSATNNE